MDIASISKYHMVLINPFLLMGTVTDMGRTLLRPRIFSYGNGGKQMTLMPLPSLPKSVIIPEGSWMYEVNMLDKKLVALYEQVTSPEAEANAFKDNEAARHGTRGH